MSDRKPTPDLLTELLGGGQSSEPTPGVPEPPAVQWEYQEAIFRDYRGWRLRAVNGQETGDWKVAPLLHQYLESAGAAGWELVSLSEVRHNQRDAYLKRIKRGKP